MSDRYEPPPPHEIPEEAVAYVAQMSQKDRELHELAVQLLGSSYFVEWSAGFKKWKAKQANAPGRPAQ
jgi:hypothetical protein